MVKEKNVSIVCDTNWGKTVYDSLYLTYNTPFIDVIINPDDYVKLISDIPKYLANNLMYVKERDLFSPPIGKLGDITISFPTHKSFCKAKEQWEKQCKNFNCNDYIVTMSNFTNEEQITKFNLLAQKSHNMFAFYNTTADGTTNFVSWNNNNIRKKYRWFGNYFIRTAYRKFDDIKEYSILDMLIGNDFNRMVK